MHEHACQPYTYSLRPFSRGVEAWDAPLPFIGLKMYQSKICFNVFNLNISAKHTAPPPPLDHNFGEGGGETSPTTSLFLNSHQVLMRPETLVKLDQLCRLIIKNIFVSGTHHNLSRFLDLINANLIFKTQIKV